MGCTECSGCQAFDKCINKEIANKCKEPVCSVVPISAEFPNGYTCESPDAPERNCEDFICIANGIAPAYLVGAQKDAFLKLFECYDADCESIICTVDSCDENTGCVHDNLPCFVEEGSCNATLGCFEKNNIYGLEPGICQITTVWSLIDFCGRCRGDNIDCFFQTVVPAQTIAGITAGAVGGITVAAIIGAAIAIWLSKKGYDYYKSMSQVNAAALHQNPYYVQNEFVGEVPQGLFPTLRPT